MIFSQNRILKVKALFIRLLKNKIYLHNIYFTMKQNKGPLILLTVLTIFIFKNSQIIHDTILFSCELFLTKLFPSLFPMMILSELFIYFDLPDLLCKYFGSPFQKIFHTSPYGLFAFIIATFSGSPTNAYLVKNLHRKNFLTTTEASHVLSFSFFNNPLFLFTMLSLIFPNNPSTVIKLLVLPYLINLLIGFITRPKTTTYIEKMPESKENFGTMLSNSIKNAMNTLLFILGTITIFLIVNQCINPSHLPVISGILEISQGLNSLIDISYSLKMKEILAILFISFGGLSIHLQIKGIISSTDISYFTFLKARFLQSIISILLILIW